MRTKHTFRLPPDLAGKLADYANRKGVTQALVVEAALASHLSPDGADRLEAALARRLDRITRHLERIERRLGISNEALAVFVRFWLTSTPALPNSALAAAQMKGRERYDGFVEALGGGSRADVSSQTRSFMRLVRQGWEKAAECRTISRYAHLGTFKVPKPEHGDFAPSIQPARRRTSQNQ